MIKGNKFQSVRLSASGNYWKGINTSDLPEPLDEHFLPPPPPSLLPVKKLTGTARNKTAGGVKFSFKI